MLLRVLLYTDNVLKWAKTEEEEKTFFAQMVKKSLNRCPPKELKMAPIAGRTYY